MRLIVWQHYLKKFFFFERILFCSPMLHLFEQKYSKNCEILLQFKITFFYFNILWNVIYSCDQSWIVSIITPVCSVTWSFRNHSNMLICCSRNITSHYQCWKQLCCFIFLWIFFSGFFLMNRKLKGTAFIWKSFVTL